MKLIDSALSVFLMLNFACQKTPETQAEKRESKTVASLSEISPSDSQSFSSNNNNEVTKELVLSQLAFIGVEATKVSDAALERPIHLTFDQHEKIYVLDLAQNIQKYSLTGKLISIFGRKGQGPDEFMDLRALECLNEKLYAYDNHNLRITILDTLGNILNEFSMQTYFKDKMNKPDIQKFFASSDTSIAFLRVKNDYSAQLVRSMLFLTNPAFSNYRQLLEVSVPMQGYIVGGAQGGFIYYHNNIILDSQNHYWVTPSIDYVIHCYTPEGKIIRTIERFSLRQKYTQEEKQAARKNVVTLLGISYRMELPDFQQDIQALIPDTQGRIWVKTSRRDSQRRNHFEVFDLDGNFLFHVWGQLNDPREVHFYKDIMITLHTPDESYPFIRVLNYSLRPTTN